jgi:NAD(P)H-nitrite reductase large subunit
MQLDEDGSILFENTVSESGVTALTGESADEILGDDSVTGLRLKNGNIVEADLILFSVGIRPNLKLAKEAGIAVNRGIMVNEKMETSIGDIYACGDNAELNGRIYGNWPAASEMGKTAGANAAGEEAAFKDFVSSVVFNAMNSQIFSVGDVKTAGNNVEVLSSVNAEKRIYKKLFFKDKKLVGGILMGDTKRSVRLMKAVQSGKLLADALKEEILV